MQGKDKDMNFQLYIPTRIVSGDNCLQKHAELLRLGRHALLVTGKTSARRSGVLDDLIPILTEAGIYVTVFDQITENPLLETCYAGGQLAARCGADFVIGIGGGSPIDAAKAIASFAANPQMQMLDLFEAEKRVRPSLPIVAIPTTAGTGTEANPYSIMTLPDHERKKTYSAPDSWARVAFLDPKYTATLSVAYTLSTALDAFAHALESYLSPKSTDLSEMMALYAARKIWRVIGDEPAVYDMDMRRELMAAACAAGIAISVTGTGFPHPLGYSITMLDGVPHGAACALFDGDYLEYNERTDIGREKLARFYNYIGADGETLKKALPRLSGVKLSFTEEESDRRVRLISGAKNYVNSPYVLSVEEMYEIYRKHFLK
jgi:alcohol dehydrogenase class IV